MRSRRDLRRTDPYFEPWDGYRQIVRAGYLQLLALLVGVAALVVVMVVGDRFRLWELPLAAIAFQFLVDRLITPFSERGDAKGWESIEWPCPRCGRPFLRGPTGFNGFARRCLN